MCFWCCFEPEKPEPYVYSKPIDEEWRWQCKGPFV